MQTKTKKTTGSRSPNDIDRAVGIKLRKLRAESGMTLQQLADKIGVSHQQLQKYETGTNRLSAGMLPAIANALGVEIMEFFSDPHGSEATKMTAAGNLRRECETLLRRTKSEETLRAMMRVLKALST